MQVHKAVDLKVHHKSPKGQLMGVTPYRRYCSGSTVLYEMPTGSKNWVYENGSPVPVNMHPSLPEVVTEKSQSQTLVDLAAKNDALEKELASLKSEKNPVVVEKIDNKEEKSAESPEKAS